MFFGAHVLLLSNDAEADRAFLRDVLDLPYVDAGEGWLIFALPPTEGAIHPTEDTEPSRGLADAVVYLMTADLEATVASLEAKGVELTPYAEDPWGRNTSFLLPSGNRIGLYQPTHPTAI
ncbi:MAG TPA: VOC family protein [Gaiellaceae bacterium]|nr:VOC family protein [Gaiellaceae bacterium]